MHADNRSVDHLDSGIVGSGKRVYDAAPDTGPPPPNEAASPQSLPNRRKWHGAVLGRHCSFSGKGQV